MDIEDTYSQEREAVNELGKEIGRAEPRKRPDVKLTERQRQIKKKKRGRSDVEIDRRVFNGHTVVLLEDSTMMEPDGTSSQYIIAIESTSKDGKVSLIDKRYISGLIKKQGYDNAYDGARAIFLNPEGFREILGEHWVGYEHEQTKQEDLHPLFGSQL